MKYSIILLFMLIPLLSLGQLKRLTDEEMNASRAAKLLFSDSISQAVALARNDIAKNTPFLLLQGGIAPTSYPSDAQFKKDFKVYFYEFGCTGPEPTLANEYNKITFEYLTKVYGKAWIKRARRDILGLKEFLSARR